MSFDPFYVFVLVGLASPGPNIVLLLSSGARFGFRRTLPHVLGIAIGVSVTAGLTGLGLGALILKYPTISVALKLLAAGWIFFLGYRLYNSLNVPKAESKDRPITIFEAVLFQWINPKVWAVAMAAAAGYGLGQPPLQEGLRMALAFGGINVMVCLFYANAGNWLARFFNTPVLWRRFMTVMAVMMGLSGLAIFL
ncbi:MAG: LysE family translocator [Paracoccaceae bacterium]|jgi:threonine/homoserine/homoserine lactone efflux protein